MDGHVPTEAEEKAEEVAAAQAAADAAAAACAPSQSPAADPLASSGVYQEVRDINCFDTPAQCSVRVGVGHISAYRGAPGHVHTGQPMKKMPSPLPRLSRAMRAAPRG